MVCFGFFFFYPPPNFAKFDTLIKKQLKYTHRYTIKSAYKLQLYLIHFQWGTNTDNAQ